MKRNLIIFLITAFVGITFINRTNSFSEDIQKSWYTGFENMKQNNFFEVQKKFNDYWKDKNPEKGSGWKVFKRWEYFWEQRLDSTGIFPNMAKIYQNWNDYLAKNKHKESILASNYKWTFLGPSSPPFKRDQQDPQGVGVGRMNCIRFDPSNPNIIWAGSAYGGVWKSTDGGNSWATFPFTEFMSIGISDIAISPLNPNIVYVATGDADGSMSGSALYSIGVLKTTDGGKTWTTTGLGSNINNGLIIYRLIIHPTHPDTLFAATTSGLLASFNGGTNWFQMVNTYIRDLEFKPDNSNIIYAPGVVTGQNNQQFYTVIKIDLVAGQYSYNYAFSTNEVIRMAAAVSPANPNYIYAVSTASDLGFHSVIKSTDGGATWNIIAQRTATTNYLHENWAATGNGGQGHYDLAIGVSRTNANEVYIGGVNIWKSTDGGTSWALNAEWTGLHQAPWIHADQHDIAFSPAGILYSANDGGISKSTNGGITWAEINNGLGVTEFYRLSSAPATEGIIYGGTQDNGTHRLLAREWKNVLGGDGMECLVDPTNSNIVYASLYYGDFRKSTNGGNNFTQMINRATTNEQAGWVTPLVMDPKFPTILYAGYQNVWKSTDRGLTWNKLGVMPTNNIIWAMAIAPSNTNIIYVSKQGGIWKSTNGGQNWTQVITGGIITGIAVAPNNPDKIWFTSSGYTDSAKVYLLDGTNFSNISGSLPNVPANCIVYQNNSPDRIYIGTDVGVFYRDNRLNDWQLFNNGLPNVVISDIDIHYASKKIRTATYGRGLWENDLIECNAPLPNILYAKTDICQGDSIKLEVPAIYRTYNWSTGASSNFIWVKTEGSYSVTVTDTNDCTYSSEPVNIYVHEIPNISIKVTGNTTFCEGDSVTLQGNPWLTFQTWNWSDGRTGRTIVVKESGTYTVTGTTQYGCKNTSAPVDVTVNPNPPKPTITREGNILKSSDAKKYQWYFNDTVIVLATNQFYAAKKNGRYTVKVYNESDCWTLSDPIDVILGIDEALNNDIINIQPNPVTDEIILYIHQGGLIGKANIEISNIQGEKLFSLENLDINGEYRKIIDMSRYSTGVYFIRIKTGTNVFNKKLIKE